MDWVFLTVAGFFEIFGAMSLGASKGFTRPLPTIAMFIFMGISLYLLSLSLATIPISTAYAIWTGIGAAGTAICGIIFMKDSAAWPRLVCLALIVGGVIGLKLVS